MTDDVQAHLASGATYEIRMASTFGPSDSDLSLQWEAPPGSAGWWRLTGPREHWLSLGSQARFEGQPPNELVGMLKTAATPGVLAPRWTRCATEGQEPVRVDSVLTLRRIE